MAKLFAGDLAQRVAYDCQQFYGGMGYVEETADRPRLARRPPASPSAAARSEIMKEIISKLVPGF